MNQLTQTCHFAVWIAVGVWTQIWTPAPATALINVALLSQRESLQRCGKTRVWPITNQNSNLFQFRGKRGLRDAAAQLWWAPEASECQQAPHKSNKESSRVPHEKPGRRPPALFLRLQCVPLLRKGMQSLLWMFSVCFQITVRPFKMYLWWDSLKNMLNL